MEVGLAILKRAVIFQLQSLYTGMSVTQVADLQNASGGMWAFSELTAAARLLATAKPSPKVM